MRILGLAFALLAAANASLAQDDAVATEPSAEATTAATLPSAEATLAAATPPGATEAEALVAPAEGGVKTLSGMSILGNEEAPTSLVIVPWKSSRLGDGIGVTNALDETPRALDRDVFMRELRYYELRSGEAE